MVQTDPDQWHSGSFAEISKLIPGCTNGWLQIWLIIAGGVSGIAIQNSCVACTASELYCNAHC